MKKSIYYLIALFAVSTACTAFDDSFAGSDGQDNGITKLVAGRSGAYGVSGTSWEENSRMTVADLSSGTPVEHSFTYQSGRWDKTDSEEFSWPSDGADMPLTAWLDMEGASLNEFVMPSSNGIIDQTDGQKIKACDFLGFTGSVPFGNALTFNFSHVMAKLVLNVSLEKGLDSDYTTKGLVEASFPMSAGLVRSDVSSDWKAKSDEKTLKAEVSPLTDKSQTITAIVVPGKFDREITLAVEDITGQNLELKAKASDFVFEAGRVYSLPLSLVNRDGVLHAVIGDVTVQEWAADLTIDGPVSDNTVEIVTPWDGTPATEYAGGSGAKDDPWQIATPGQLALMRDEINNASSHVSDSYILTADLELNKVAWTPAGIKTNVYFNGIFDGNGHSISGLNINAGNSDTYAGLFGYSRGTIKNLTVKEPAVVSASTVATSYTSAIVAQGASITIENCHVSGGKIDVSSASGKNVYCGSIAGQIAANSITACSSTASLTARAGNMGGIVGYLRGNTVMQACYAAVSITQSEGAAGGLIGLTQNKYEPSVTGCYSISELTGDAKKGGIIGTFNGGTYSGCYYVGTSDPAGNSKSIEGVSAVENISETEGVEMNKVLDGSGWLYIAAETDSSFPYIIKKVEIR